MMENWSDVPKELLWRSIGVMTDYSNQARKNKNRGYQQLRVWNDAVDYYKQTSMVFQKFPYELKPENSLLKLIESLEQKRTRGDWIDQLTVMRLRTNERKPKNDKY